MEQKSCHFVRHMRIVSVFNTMFFLVLRNFIKIRLKTETVQNRVWRLPFCSPKKGKKRQNCLPNIKIMLNFVFKGFF